MFIAGQPGNHIRKPVLYTLGLCSGLAGSSEAAREAWWQHYIGVKEELVQTVLQDLPPGETLIPDADAGDRAPEPSGDPANGASDEAGVADDADEGPPRSCGLGEREMRGDAAAAGASAHFVAACTSGA